MMEGHPKYSPHARAGQIAVGNALGNALLFRVEQVHREFLEWKDREKGGGLIAQWRGYRPHWPGIEVCRQTPEEEELHHWRTPHGTSVREYSVYHGDGDKFLSVQGRMALILGRLKEGKDYLLYTELVKVGDLVFHAVKAREVFALSMIENKKLDKFSRSMQR